VEMKRCTRRSKKPFSQRSTSSSFRKAGELRVLELKALSDRKRNMKIEMMLYVDFYLDLYYASASAYGDRNICELRPS
jgi:hypothetical protein